MDWAFGKPCPPGPLTAPHPRRYHIYAVHENLPGDNTSFNGVVHPVQAAQKGGFTAPGRPDHGNHFVATNIQGHIANGFFGVVINSHILDSSSWGVFNRCLPHVLPVPSAQPADAAQPFWANDLLLVPDSFLFLFILN